MSRLPALLAAITILALPAVAAESKDAGPKLVKTKDLPRILQCKATWKNTTEQVITLTPFVDIDRPTYGYLAVAVPAAKEGLHERINLVAMGLAVSDGDVPTRNYLQIQPGQEIYITPRYGADGKFQMYANLNIEKQTFPIALWSTPDSSSKFAFTAYSPKTIEAGKALERHFNIAKWYQFELGGQNGKKFEAWAPQLEFRAIPAKSPSTPKSSNR